MSANFYADFEEADRLISEFQEYSRATPATPPATKSPSEKSRVYYVRNKNSNSRKNSLAELEHCCKLEKQTTREQGAYLGIMTIRDAEKKISKSGNFAIYHRLPIASATDFCSNRLQSCENLEPFPTLYLNVVYLDSKNRYRHYPIIEVALKGQMFFQVSTVISPKIKKIPEREPRFLSVEKLLDHYTKFAYGYHFDENGGIEVDVFPAQRK